MNFTIFGTLPTMNEIISASKKHWSVYSSMKRHYTNKVVEAIPPGYAYGKINLVITWYNPNKRRDPDNVSGGGQKFILDALVKSGVIEDDSPTYIHSIHHVFYLDKDVPRIQVKVIEIADKEN